MGTEAIQKGNEMLKTNLHKRAIACLMAVAAVASAGCLATHGVSMGILSVPIPVSPYHQTKAEDDNWVKERYSKVPILGPIAAGGPQAALDPPSDDEVMRAFLKAHPLKSGIPFLYDVQRNDVRIVKEKIADGTLKVVRLKNGIMLTTSAPCTIVKLSMSVGQSRIH